jgi:predicted dehydrogenase
MRVAIVGCGYVADYYVRALANHPQLELAAATDADPERCSRFGSHHGVAVRESLDAILEDDSIELCANLTNPRSHYEVSRACLEAGKHVYSEKPLAMEMKQAERLVELAEQSERYLASAPCSILGESFQTLWAALRAGSVGKVRLAYAELDDGLIHRSNYRTWLSESGAPWPWKDEFEVGCTLEHAGYYVTWLTALFGPARAVTSFASCVVPDKQTDVPLDRESPDFSVACLEFDSGVVARLTSSIIAPEDRSLRIIGDEGVLRVDDCWDYGSRVALQRRTPLLLRVEKKSPRLARLVGERRLRLARRPRFEYDRHSEPMDFARGMAEMADAIAEARPCRLSARYALHINEIVLAIQNPRELGGRQEMTSSFAPIEPMPWAASQAPTR